MDLLKELYPEFRSSYEKELKKELTEMCKRPANSGNTKCTYEIGADTARIRVDTPKGWKTAGEIYIDYSEPCLSYTLYDTLRD